MLTKKVYLKKVRRWDENIGKLIVFAVTIIVAVGVLGTLAYFYNQSRENATQLSLLTSTTSSTNDLKDAGFCTGTDTAYIKYDPVKDMYWINCGWDDKVEKDNIKKVKGIIWDQDCSSNLTGKVDYCYKVNR